MAKATNSLSQSTPHTFQPLGTAAANVVASIPLNPDYIFRHISIHCVHVLARQLAKKAIQAQLRDQGGECC